MNDKIVLKNTLLSESPEVNQRLVEAGYTLPQVQVFYDVIAEELMPVIEELLVENARTGEQSKLESYFGGPEKAKEVVRQVFLWAKKNLDADLAKVLSSTADGVFVLYHMMRAGEPSTADIKSGKEETPLSDKDLKKLMQSPAYWRDKDAGVVSKVENGFKRLYDQA